VHPGLAAARHGRGPLGPVHGSYLHRAGYRPGQRGVKRLPGGGDQTGAQGRAHVLELH